MQFILFIAEHKINILCVFKCDLIFKTQNLKHYLWDFEGLILNALYPLKF